VKLKARLGRVLKEERAENLLRIVNHGTTALVKINK